LLLDPYFRTIEGFGVLVTKEWLSSGHRFLDRVGHGTRMQTDKNEVSPVFVQFLDGVFQIWSQFPCHFEFDQKLLIFLLDHLFSGRYGDFLCNDEKSRLRLGVYRGTESVWSILRISFMFARFLAENKLTARQQSSRTHQTQKIILEWHLPHVQLCFFTIINFRFSFRSTVMRKKSSFQNPLFDPDITYPSFGRGGPNSTEFNEGDACATCNPQTGMFVTGRFLLPSVDFDRRHAGA
jgi:hypothetical protein